MRIKNPVLLTAFAALFSLLCFNGNSQKLPESRQSSYFSYIYKITDKEAEKVYRNNLRKTDSSFFHTLTDSFPTDQQYTGYLPPGHYLQLYSERNEEKISITSIQDFEVFILNNNTDLHIQVVDLQGNIIPDAKVSTGWKNLRFDKKTQAYIDRKSNQKGLLKVNYKGFTSYHNLSRQYNNSQIRRGGRKLLYGTPLKYVWIPAGFVISLPVDGVRSVVNGWPQGSIHRIKYFFTESFHKVACLFDDFYCNSYRNEKFARKHSGYMVFNKPKYFPGDTVKFKAFLVKKKGKAIDKSLKVVLYNGKKSITLARLNPYRKGGYSFEFVLHDSLQLQLDKRYSLTLELNDRKEYISGSFTYEDYELTKNHLSLRFEEESQYRNKAFTIFAKGTDENSLNLLDARLEILIKPVAVSRYFKDHLFIPDTLLFIERTLEPTAETEIVIPDSLFPEINFEYEIQARLLTSDNEADSQIKKVNFYHAHQEIETSLTGDSLHVSYLKNGILQNEQAKMTAIDNFGNNTPVYTGTTPFKVKLNPYYASYTIESDSISDIVNIASFPPLLQCFSERTIDSVHIVIDNPRNITFSYNIYKRNTPQSAGYTDSLEIIRKTNTKQDYFVSIRYLWGGEIKEENYNIPLREKTLQVSFTQPKTVYPGQKSRIGVLVTDIDGRPVQGVDLTAYGLTSKFNYAAQELPYHGKTRKSKTLINNFNFKKFNFDDPAGQTLDYEIWKKRAGLDTIEYYKFIYPEQSIYRSAFVTTDSLTQFSPFVVSEGEIQPVHVVYVDSKPVYFSWSTHTRPYSFAIDSGYHQVKLRTSFSNITIDSLYFKKGEKVIFSLEKDLRHPQVKTEQAKPELSNYEQKLLYKYIFPYRDTFGERPAYAQQGDAVQLLNSPGPKYRHQNLAGPVSGPLSFHLTDSFTTHFNHEPFFEYEFSPALLKMRSTDSRLQYPKHLNFYQPVKSLTDSVLTKEVVAQQWKAYLGSKRRASARYQYPHSSSPGTGKLLISTTWEGNKPYEIPLNILLFKQDHPEFLRVYPGSTTLLHQLDEGLYKLIFFYEGAGYHIADSIHVKADGINYHEIQQPDHFLRDTLSIYVSELIEKSIFKPIPYGQEEKELKQISNSYQQQHQYSGQGGNIVEGYVYDIYDGSGLPRVNIRVKGTKFGTVSNLDGYYSIRIPSGSDILTYGFVGYIQEEVPVLHKNIININLEPDIKQLQEVIVTGYSVQNKTSLTGSLATVSSQSLSGGIPGAGADFSQSLQGKAAGVTISGQNGPAGPVSIQVRGLGTMEFDKSPLYVINGTIFTGDIADLPTDLIENIEILKGKEATAMYGAGAAYGVVIIKTKAGTFRTSAQAKGADYDASFFGAASQATSIRNQFSDYAFWQPALTTDKDGKAAFEVTFPDDVTSWETFFLAMNDQKQSGQTQGLIKSYKPLMAQLAVPNFLVQSDTTFAIGKVLNYYSADSIKLQTKFEVNNQPQFSKEQFCENSLIDSLQIIARSDSMSVKYFLEKEDGYFDGELRNIPVFPLGLEETRGSFHVLEKDTSLHLSFDPAFGPVKLYARADILEVLEDEISQLINYKYFCNEQIASKLKALLAEKTITTYKGVEFKNNSQVEKMIRLLSRNQKPNRLWGWWKDTDDLDWISLHVLEALVQAEKMGYKNGLNKSQISEKLVWRLENNKDFNSGIRMLKILHLMGAQVNYLTYVSRLEHTQKHSLNGLLQIMEVKQLSGLPYETDTLFHYQKKTLFGNIYFAGDNPAEGLQDNEIQNTLIAYRILKAKFPEKINVFTGIRNYLLEKKGSGSWTNTYETAQIIETILPELTGAKHAIREPVLTIDGDSLQKTITKFPFEMEISGTPNFEISKTGDYPVYFTHYQRYWNGQPEEKKGDFEISTRFENDSSSWLKAGRETKLIARVIVKEDAEFVMINVPVPAGCSYADKSRHFRNESHREYFKNETTIFCESLKKGEYPFEIKLMPRYSGTYTLNPARVELMYFPVFNANNSLKRIGITAKEKP